jgi:hypothetical protein
LKFGMAAGLLVLLVVYLFSAPANPAEDPS